MVLTQRDAAERFGSEIQLKFQLYNSLFLSLPFRGIEKTGALLSLFSQACDAGFEDGYDPISIINGFFEENTKESSESEKIDLLFRFVQYAERQVVLFDALEDAAFARLHDLQGPGTLKQLEREVAKNNERFELLERAENFRVRLVLTAHPTQFYPGSVLAIINDLSGAIELNDVMQVRLLLQQLGRTPFLKKEKPTPFDEAESLIWYLENVFYGAIGEIGSEFSRAFDDEYPLVKIGFWSGGDRDGNPFVTKETTAKTARALRRAIFRNYYSDIRKLRRRLTFEGVEEVLEFLEERVYAAAFGDNDEPTLSSEDLLFNLVALVQVIQIEHNGLFLDMVTDLANKVAAFGTHFASLDIRQDSSVHAALFEKLAEDTDLLPADWRSSGEDEKIAALLRLRSMPDGFSFGDETLDDTIANLRTVRDIQKANGVEGCHRYIISHSQSAAHVIEVMGLFALAGWDISELPIDVVPLFETVDDLRNAPDVMRKLYAIQEYRQHLSRRGDLQTIMLGFSDGTKDGGYLMANYGIYRAKHELTEAALEFGIDVVFFDGRGGPPARGGGKTHRFYASMGTEISAREIQLTIQGQTVSSNFGTVDAARYNIEQMVHAGLYGAVRMAGETTFREGQEDLVKEMAEASFRAYSDLKSDPAFLDYLEKASPLNFYTRTNIGSRPAKRGGADTKLSLDSLRAIPFVGAWSQMKQNVPGFYGVGTALEELSKEGRLGEATELYACNRFFKALIDNCEMALEKTFLPLTSHLEGDPEFSGIWKKIRDEYDLCCAHLQTITGTETFMDDFPIAKQSVLMRERIVRPLAAIQQYGLERIRKGEGDRAAFEKLVMRCSFGIINAGRNSA
jgi:phosphoenolpyruvate carboxylase